MAEATKSILLVDYDSIHRSLSAADSDAIERLTPRIAAWVGALEAGSLFTEKPGAAGRRRVLIRRCYADPALLSDNRAAFLANGFQVIDCPVGEGRERNAAAIHIVLDSIEALDHPAGYEEFILFSVDSDLSPLLIQLRAHNRQTAIYATEVTADSYRAIADAIVEQPRFLAVLSSDSEASEEAHDERAATHPPATRSEIEALARKISSATNVPLFAPRTFAELFRHLVEEVADNGYHFQTTAENVANRMAEAGRSVSRRQVVFVVKGLALKGHMFSTGDTPEQLADVFREQVTYLAENAGLSLDDNERRIMSAWIVGQGSTATQTAAQGTERQKKSAATTVDFDKPDTAKDGNGQSGRAARKRPSSGDATTETAKPAAASVAASGSEKSKTTGEPKPTAPATAESTSRSKLGTTSSTASTAASAGSRTSAKSDRQATRSDPADAADEDPVETSILAAIAQAVDVLVEDSENTDGTEDAPEAIEPDEIETKAGRGKSTAPAEEEPANEPDDGESDDIGDEIQRIIASYSRNRNKDAE